MACIAACNVDPEKAYEAAHRSATFLEYAAPDPHTHALKGEGSLVLIWICRISEENKLFERPLGLAGERRLLRTALRSRIDTPNTSKCFLLCQVCPER